MASAFAVLLIAALLTAATAAWVLRAYRRADGGAALAAAPAFALAGLAGCAALGVYLVIGRPDLPDAPYAARFDGLMARVEQGAPITREEALVLWQEAARRSPNAARPQIEIGNLYHEAGMPAEAARAFDAALRREPNAPDALMGLGRAMAELDQGRISAQTADVLRAAADAAPDDPTPWLYLAMGAMLEDRAADAQAFWRQAHARLGPDDPRRAMAERMMTETPP